MIASIRNFLKRLWGDIKTGDNLELAILVVSAFGLLLLNLFGIGSQLVPAVTLAVLALLALAMLGNRYRLEDISKTIVESGKNTRFLSDRYPNDFDEDFSRCSELWIWGIGLSSVSLGSIDAITQKLTRGHRVRVLMVDPRSKSFETISTRVPTLTADEYRQISTTSLERFRMLKTRWPQQVEVKVVDYPLSLAGFVCDPSTERGVMYFRYHSYKVGGALIPKFTVVASDEPWFDFFRTELNSLWDDATDW